MFLAIPILLGFMALAAISLYYGLYLFVPWWKLPRRWTDTPLWTRVWVWGWTLMVQGIILLYLTYAEGISDPSALPVFIGSVSAWIAPVCWFIAGCLYRSEIKKQTRVARRV